MSSEHARRLAAAVYDRYAAGPAEDRAVFVGAGGAAGGRTVLCEITLAGDPPEPLRVAIAETLALLRVLWIALLRCEDGSDRRRLDAAHAALQCEIVATDWAWSGGGPAGGADGHALGRTLTRRRERHRAELAAPPPRGLGLLVPHHARANEALPPALEESWRVLSRDLHDDHAASASRIRDEALDALGGWRLGELGAAEAEAAIEALSPRSQARPVVPEPPALRAAS